MLSNFDFKPYFFKVFMILNVFAAIFAIFVVCKYYQSDNDTKEKVSHGTMEIKIDLPITSMDVDLKKEKSYPNNE